MRKTIGISMHIRKIINEDLETEYDEDIDIYDDYDQLLEDDVIDALEAGFMSGYQNKGS